MKSYDNYVIKDLMRSKIKVAEYNPRKITDSNRQKLKRKIKEVGLVMPIVVNQRTMSIVSGHQRISILDEIYKGQDYKIKSALIDVDKKEEVKLNIFLNNQSTMGEWDFNILSQIPDIVKGIDFEKDLGFDKIDIELMFSETDNFDKMSDYIDSPEIAKEIKTDVEKIKEIKAEGREKNKKLNNEGLSGQTDKDDYMLTFIFNCNSEKQEFMTKINKHKTERFLNSSVLYDLFEKHENNR